MTTKKTLLALSTIAVIIIISSSSCANKRRWYSTYKDPKTKEIKTEHYNGYRKRWYKRNWNNGRMWK
ncbi:MAG: hypothetical protein K9G49_10285 [Taibaiella sp.]|nr:hypothetical protein [Taibaiella sp.]